MTSLLPSEAVAEVAGLLYKQPCFLTGSAVSADVHGLTEFNDVDIFTPTQHVLVSTVQQMLDRGFTMDDRATRMWYRWLRYGLKGWHTNSIRLHSLKDVEVNVVYKINEGHPTTSLSQVLESFDFGLLATGWDLETDQFRDLRPYLFPGLDPDGPLPMMPNKRGNWARGFISEYNGIREASRYAKYHRYGYDMSLIKPDLVSGYQIASLYHADAFKEDKQLLGQIYGKLAELIDADDIDELLGAYDVIDQRDGLDAIMDALE